MPADPSVTAALDSLGISYEVMEIDPDLADTAEFCEAYDIPLENSANAILVASRKPEGHNAVCLVLATTRLDVNGAVRKRLGVRKVSFAPADVTMELTGQEIGGVTAFGLPEVHVLTDAGIAEDRPCQEVAEPLAHGGGLLGSGVGAESPAGHLVVLDRVPILVDDDVGVLGGVGGGITS